ncbi:hypothetical protein Ancab_008010 [Ancistrocladus abbreviatus]
MAERKLFKTKLCVLYQRGHCGRQTCSFAHGEAELRRYSGSFNGRRVNRSNDLRARLERRRSPQRKYSPGRGARGRHLFHGYSPPTGLGRRKYQKTQNVDGQSDFSGSLRDGTEDRGKEEKLVSFGSRNVLQEQLKQVKCDVDLLVDQKHQLEVELEERTQEADSLSSRIQDLEAQLSDEKENSRRITSKIRKFIRAHSHYTRLQDDLKRSQVRLDKLVEDLSSAQLGANEEDSSINIISDGENIINHFVNRFTESKKENASPAKKWSDFNMEVVEGSKSVNMVKTGHLGAGQETSLRTLKRSQLGSRKEAEMINKRKAVERPQSNEGKQKRRKDAFTGALSADMGKGLDSNLVVPPTGMAAHAVDEFNDLTEPEEKAEVVEAVSTMVQDGVGYEAAGLLVPLPPLPPVSQNNYLQYKGDDGEVDVDGLEEELVEVDIV